jgi:hypothetical protein
VAKKRGKSVGAKKTGASKTPKASKPPKTRVAAKPEPRGGSREPAKSRRPAATRPASVTPRRPSAPALSAAVPPSLLERAERLRDDILLSKMSHPDPWNYTAKARAFGERAQRIVDDAAAGREAGRALQALVAEVEGDRDYREARRLL